MTELTLLQELKKNPFFLAPMAGITDHPFRSFMKEMGCGIVTTELVSAKSLQMNHKRSKKLMSFNKDQRPVGIQIFGEDLEALSIGAKIAENTGADFIDLNFGCPVTKIIKKGAGSAILKDLSFLRKILRAVKNSVSIPVSIKVRTGWDYHSRNTHEVLKIANDEGIIWISIHGRTRAQAYSGKADWSYITEVKNRSPLPVIGNGDLTSANQILNLKKESQCDGMMVGRGCLKNPWLFQEVKNSHLYSSQKFSSKYHPPYTVIQNPPIVNKSYLHVLNRLKYHLENFYDEHMFLIQYKKFATWYSSGHPQSTEFRRQVFQTKEKKQVIALINEYFSQIHTSKKQNPHYEPSLMQGHG